MMNRSLLKLQQSFSEIISLIKPSHAQLIQKTVNQIKSKIDFWREGKTGTLSRWSLIFYYKAFNNILRYYVIFRKVPLKRHVHSTTARDDFERRGRKTNLDVEKPLNQGVVDWNSAQIQLQKLEGQGAEDDNQACLTHHSILQGYSQMVTHLDSTQSRA